MMTRIARARVAAIAMLFGWGAAACQGSIGDPDESTIGDDGSNGPLACTEVDVQASSRPMRRLSPDQYANTMRDLLGDAGYTAVVDPGGDIITEREVRQIRDAAEALAGRSGTWTQPVFPCDVGGEANTACVADFIDTFVTRAFRRPVTDAERAWLLGIYDEAIATVTFAEAMEILLQVVLQAPQLVYMFEAGVPDASPDTRQLSTYEVASRLSYLLWNTMPDDALLDAASTGELAEADGLQRQAERLLADPRAEKAVVDFMSSWLQLDGGILHHALEDTEKDPTLYPEYGPELRAAMRTELEAFVKRTFFEGGSFNELLTSNQAYVNGDLARLYGVDGPSDADTWSWVTLDPQKRAGLLTRAAFLTVLSTKNVTAPIRRGVWVLEELACTELGTPPPNVNNIPPEGGLVAGEVLSVRQDVAARTAGDGCTSCHSLINPAGFTFEHYDAIGRWQDEEITSGKTIDATGSIVSTGDADGPVDGAVELSQKLAGSATARNCFAERWYTQAIGRELGDLDKCSLESLQGDFAEGGSMRDLVIAIIKSDAFRYIHLSGADQ